MERLPPPTFTNDFVTVDVSTIPDAGNGLFARVDIPAGTRITDYKGVTMPWKEYVATYGKDYKYSYTMMRQNKIICGRDHLTENPSHYCNESLTPNVYYKNKGLYSVRDIVAGEELFLKYFNWYKRDYKL